MKIRHWFPVTILALMVGTPSHAQRNPEEDIIDNPNCSAFGTRRDSLQRRGLPAAGLARRDALSSDTVSVAASLPRAAATLEPAATAENLIDGFVFSALEANRVKPAPDTTDWEFIRRASLDLTGRLPDPQRVISFVNDTDTSKRARLVDELLAKSEWVDKWANYFGDLLKNNSSNSQIRRFADGVTAFDKWIRDSLAANKPYDQMTRELIAARTANSYADGDANWIVGGVVTGGPIQDIWDKQAANVADTFLGISHLDCVLCHNGRGHLDALSLWGRGVTRQQAWSMAAFMSKTRATRVRVQPDRPVPYYWAVDEDPRLRTDYPLNTTTGNRPERQPVGDLRFVAPEFIFGGQKPEPGENYREALGRFVTGDFQFARATANYMWEAFFSIGIVNPSNQFDPARLDPANPPANCPPGSPCTLQPSHPELLNALAQFLIDNQYDIKALQRLIANSRAYQLSSRYEGEWNPTWTTLFARKMVRRLWAEEIHDAVTQSSGLLPNYTLRAYDMTNVRYAMKFPEPSGTPDGPNGAVARFLDSFFRGDRDEEQRRGEGSLAQALNLMNDNFVVSRVRSTAQGGLLARNLNLTDESLVDVLFLNVLSRYPTADEKSAAAAGLKTGNRAQQAENLLWSLYNKVDFIFNY